MAGATNHVFLPLGTFTTHGPHPSHGGNTYDDPWRQSIITMWQLGMPLESPQLETMGGRHDTRERLINDDHGVKPRVSVARTETVAATATAATATGSASPTVAVRMVTSTPAPTGEPTQGSVCGHGRSQRLV